MFEVKALSNGFIIYNKIMILTLKICEKQLKEKTTKVRRYLNYQFIDKFEKA